jgi:maltose O-acetyltransferase
MASLSYLWSNRAKPAFGSVNFFRAWAKRLLLLPDVLERNRRRRRLVSKGATIHECAEIGEVRIDGRRSNLSVGSFTFLGRIYVMAHARIDIGKHVCINDGVEILTASHDVEDAEWKQFAMDVVIEDYVWIGMGAMILPGVRLGRGAVVGARAVVSKSVPPGAIVVGNPARAVSKTRSMELNYNPCAFLAANLAWLAG